MVVLSGYLYWVRTHGGGSLQSVYWGLLLFFMLRAAQSSARVLRTQLAPRTA